MIRVKINGVGVSLNQVAFSDGAGSLTFVGTLPRNPVSSTIFAKADKSLPELFFEIAQAVNVLRHLNSRIIIELHLPYMPYARQDRRMVRNDSFSLEVFADLLNSLNIDKVISVDVHSDVSHLVKRLHVISQDDIMSFSWVRNALPYGDVLVSPDAGSLKKIEKVADILNPSGRVTMSKIRDASTGRIVESEIIDCDLSSLKDRSCIIVDDICDGGATFIQAAYALKEAGASKVSLWVTHGIFSRGITPLYEGGIDRIFTTDSIYSPVPVDMEGKLVVIPIEPVINNIGVSS